MYQEILPDTGKRYWKHEPEVNDGFNVVLVDDVACDIAVGARTGANLGGDRELLEHVIQTLRETFSNSAIIISEFKPHPEDYDGLLESLISSPCVFLVDVFAGLTDQEPQGLAFANRATNTHNFLPNQVGLFTKQHLDQINELFGSHAYRFLSKVVVRPGAADAGDRINWHFAVDPVVAFVAEVKGDGYVKAAVAWRSTSVLADSWFANPGQHDVFDHLEEPGCLSKIQGMTLHEDPSLLSGLSHIVGATNQERVSLTARLCCLKGMSRGRFSWRFFAELFGCAGEMCDNNGLQGQATISGEFAESVMASACYGATVLAAPTSDIAAPGQTWQTNVEADGDKCKIVGHLTAVSELAASRAATELNMEGGNQAALPGRGGKQGMGNRAANAIRQVADIEFSHEDNNLKFALSFPTGGQPLP